MEQYISKSALVAEIDRFIKKNELYLDDNVSDAVRYQKTGAYSVLCDLRHFLDTLEVKGVDLEKEYKYFVEKDPVYNQLVNGIVGKAIAKHFFELGLKVQKGE